MDHGFATFGPPWFRVVFGKRLFIRIGCCVVILGWQFNVCNIRFYCLECSIL